MEKKIINIIIFIISITTYAQPSQSVFQKYLQDQQSSFRDYVSQVHSDFQAYRDSINQEFAAYLAKEWKDFDLQKPDPLIKKPILVPPVYDPKQPEPKPVEIPIDEVLPVVEPEPVKEPEPIKQPEPKPDVVPKYPIKAIFFGTDIFLKDHRKSALQLSGVSEKEVADYWLALSKQPHYEWEGEVLRIKKELSLNDWGVYQLLNKLYGTYFQQRNDNAQVIFNVFMLNQLGYCAKIGRSGSQLIPLVAFQNAVYNRSYFTYSNQASIKYTALSPATDNALSIKTCEVDYGNAMKCLDLSILDDPCFAAKPVTKVLTPNQGKETYSIRYNRNVVDFYTDYPCVHFAVYAEAALDGLLIESIEEQIKPIIINKSQEEAVNWLLHFVQKSFDYKTDQDQFGYEKWFFAEETIASSFSDCEDRSILFTQLVRRLLGLPVVLVHYTNVHLATAVKFDNPQTTGDYLLIDGAKYLICDPTYIGANLGMAMPNLNSTVEIIKLK